jgi:hypothetical protein
MIRQLIIIIASIIITDDYSNFTTKHSTSEPRRLGSRFEAQPKLNPASNPREQKEGRPVRLN